MGHTDKTEKQPENQLWEQLGKVHAGMLGIEGSHAHLQPMGHMKDKDGAPRLWFFTSRAGDLFRELGAGSHAHFCVVGKDQDYHACLMGDLHENRDPLRLDEYWNDVAGAWFNGKNDPDLALLEFDLLDAAYGLRRATRCASHGRSKPRKIPTRSPTWAPVRMSTSRRPRDRPRARKSTSHTSYCGFTVANKVGVRIFSVSI